MMSDFNSLVSAARAVDILTLIRERGLQLKGGRKDLAGPCPFCGGQDRFAVNLQKQVFHCRGCGANGGGAIDFVMFLDGSDFKAAVEAIAGQSHDARPTQQVKQLNGNPELALKIWRQAKNPRGTLVEVYLNGRSLDLPAEAVFEAIRFHADCPFGGERFPAMVCLVRNILTDEPQAIQRTALSGDGKAIKRGGKTFRLDARPDRGRRSQARCRRDRDARALHWRRHRDVPRWPQMGLHPVWALLGTSGLEQTSPCCPASMAFMFSRRTTLTAQAARQPGHVALNGMRRDKTFSSSNPKSVTILMTSFGRPHNGEGKPLRPGR